MATGILTSRSGVIPLINKYFNDSCFFLSKRKMDQRKFQGSRRPRPSGEKISRSAPGGDSCHPSALKVTISTYKQWTQLRGGSFLHWGRICRYIYIYNHIHNHTYVYIYIYVLPSYMGIIWQVIIRIPVNQSAGSMVQGLRWMWILKILKSPQKGRKMLASSAYFCDIYGGHRAYPVARQPHNQRFKEKPKWTLKPVTENER